MDKNNEKCRRARHACSYLSIWPIMPLKDLVHLEVLIPIWFNMYENTRQMQGVLGMTSTSLWAGGRAVPSRLGVPCPVSLGFCPPRCRQRP